MNALTIVKSDVPAEALDGAQAAHIDLAALSVLIGIPHRAIVRWTRGKDPIPFVGKRPYLMFPKEAALTWVEKNHGGLYRLRNLGGEA